MASSNDGYSEIGVAHRRYGDLPFGIALPDRLFHMYLIGQTGAGKSTLIANLARQDAAAGIGFCLIDPHGDLASHLSKNLTAPHRYWNVADPLSPYGYNPLTAVTAELRPLVASGLIGTLKKQWADAWGARMEHLLRYAILALLEQPRTDLREIVPLFHDKELRRRVAANVTDPQVQEFWRKEFPAMNYKSAIDGVAPIANKIGAFLAHPIVRKAICEPVEPLRFRRIMDAGEIIIVNLAKGRLGADVANVLGGLLVSSITNAAFSRHDQPEAARRPFFLYVDEFPAFSTTAFAGMLSELRKYRLGLVLAQQYLEQAEKAVIEAIIGNVGTIMAFRIGALDAPLFVKQLHDISIRDLVSQPNYHAYAQLMVRGLKSKTFSATTYPFPHDAAA
ncbi:MAG: type IV secretory system conjugative DNA transfer family protein [Pseudomonadota bacterium]